MSVLTPKQQQRMAALLRLSENKVCFDCGAPQPQWANTTFGLFVCMSCAGVHRSLGTHISKIQSVTLDSWTEENLIKMESIGNKGGRILYEYNIPSFRQNQGRQPSSDKKWLADKYVSRRYFHPEYVKLREEMLKNNPGSEVKKACFSKPADPLPSPAVPVEELWDPSVVVPTSSKENACPFETVLGAPSASVPPFSVSNSFIPSSASIPTQIKLDDSNKVLRSPSNPFNTSANSPTVSPQEEIISLFSSSQQSSASKKVGFAW